MRITVDELIELSKWEEYCELKGWSPHIVKEGQIDHDEDVELTLTQAKALGIIYH